MTSERSPFDEDTGDDERTERADPTIPDGDITNIERPTCMTRGLNPRAALAWVRAMYGSGGIDKVLDNLDDDDAFCLGGRNGRLVASSAWVPFLSHARLLAVIDSTFGKGNFAVLRDVGRYMGFHDFPVVARPFIRLASPGFFIDKAMKLWRMYHSHGRWEIVRHREQVRAALVEHPEHHPAFCATFCGWIEGALSLTGARDVDGSETRCASRGAPFCSFEVKWGDGKRVQERVPRPPT
jgi:predicted hydrocarbon binding protein